MRGRHLVRLCTATIESSGTTNKQESRSICAIPIVERSHGCLKSRCYEILVEITPKQVDITVLLEHTRHGHASVRNELFAAIDNRLETPPMMRS